MCFYSPAETMQCLLEHGADLEARTVDGWTPLHSACRWSNARAASLLLSCGACINAQTHSQQTPLHLAAANMDSKSVLELLLMHKDVDTSLRNSIGETAYTVCQRSNPFYYLFEIAQDHVNCLTAKR